MRVVLRQTGFSNLHVELKRNTQFSGKRTRKYNTADTNALH